MNSCIIKNKSCIIDDIPFFLTGFSFDVALPEKGKPASVEREKSSPTHSYSPPDSPSNASEPEKPFVAGPSAFDAESVFSADESKSPRGSPERPTSYESPSKEYSEGHFRKSSDGDAETNRSNFFLPYSDTLHSLLNHQTIL